MYVQYKHVSCHSMRKNTIPGNKISQECLYKCLSTINYTLWMKEMKQNTNTWIDLSFSGMGRTRTAQMFILLKLRSRGENYWCFVLSENTGDEYVSSQVWKYVVEKGQL